MKLDSHVVGSGRMGSRRSSLPLAISAALSLSASCGEDEQPAPEEDAGVVWKTPETLDLDPPDAGTIARTADAGRIVDAAVEAVPRTPDMDAGTPIEASRADAPEAMNDGGIMVSVSAGDAASCAPDDARLKWRFLQGTCGEPGALEAVMNLPARYAQDAGQGCVDESIALAGACRRFIDTTCPLTDGAGGRIGVAHTTGALSFTGDQAPAGVLKRDLVRDDGTTCSSAYEVTIERAF